MVVVLLWQTFIYGMARMTSGSLLAPILAHAVANAPLRYGERTIEIAVLAVTLAWGITRERSLLRSLGGR